MSNVPLPPIYENHAGRWIDVDDCTNYAAAVSAAKDAEIAGLRAELLKSLADNAALRERVRVLEDALRGMVIANERHSLLRVGDALTAARAALEQKP